MKYVRSIAVHSLACYFIFVKKKIVFMKNIHTLKFLSLLLLVINWQLIKIVFVELQLR